ncbi:MAG: S-adenosylmethionine decarboxylase [Candidatus Thorarchaeota archaeon]|nr:S-adenosylmethionine decarboxylase [Candidatus Thorarchaeota archaeon]
MVVGISILLDFSGVAIEKFHRALTWEKLFEDAIEIGRMTKLQISSYQFPEIRTGDVTTSGNGGATAFALLSESHISVHTWPEYEKVVIDVFTCGSHERIDSIVSFFQESVKHSELRITKLSRGDTN